MWQNKNGSYKDKNKRTKSWETLVLKYKEHYESATVQSVLKVNSLRAAYRRELQKIKSEKSGAGADDIYRPSIWYFDHLSFFQDQAFFVDGINMFEAEDSSLIPILYFLLFLFFFFLYF